jgi:hypothetical protein
MLAKMELGGGGSRSGLGFGSERGVVGRGDSLGIRRCGDLLYTMGLKMRWFVVVEEI